MHSKIWRFASLLTMLALLASPFFLGSSSFASPSDQEVAPQQPGMRLVQASFVGRSQELRTLARTLCETLTEHGISAEVRAEEVAVGGGSVPAPTLPGCAAAVTPRHSRMDELPERLRQRETPVAARIAHERLLHCLRTLRPEESAELVRAVAERDR